MKTMIAKFPGSCFSCGGPIKPGQGIAFHGKGRAEHIGCSMSAADVGDPDSDARGDEAWAPGHGVTEADLRADRRSARAGISVTRFASGAVHTQNSRGRCEDAPCCGCCD